MSLVVTLKGILNSRGTLYTWRPRGLSKSVISRDIIRVTPFRVLIIPLLTHSQSPWASKHHGTLGQDVAVASLSPALEISAFFATRKNHTTKWGF